MSNFSVALLVVSHKLTFVIGTVSDNITAPLVLAGGIFWTTLGQNFTPANVFTTLAVVALIGLGLDALITDYFLIQSGKACIERVQDYLAQEEIEDPRQSVLHSELPEKATQEERVEEFEEKPIANGERPSNCMIELRDATISPQGADEAVLAAVTLGVDRGELAMMIGPTGCGKTTLLQTFLGETNVTAKSLYVRPGQIAYCVQTAWVWNETIQANIIGESPVNMAWYEEVVEALLLKRDFGRLAKGDQTKAGSNGGNLSGGQKHRVVREILICFFIAHGLLILYHRLWHGHSMPRHRCSSWTITFHHWTGKQPQRYSLAYLERMVFSEGPAQQLLWQPTPVGLQVIVTVCSPC